VTADVMGPEPGVTVPIPICPYMATLRLKSYLRSDPDPISMRHDE
jgi:hypothetical protein